MSDATDIFGAVAMGYVIVESNRLDDWRRFLKQGLGLHETAADGNALAFRIDAHARRFMVRRGNAEDVTVSGWQVRDEATLDIIRRRLADRNIEIEASSAEDAAFRGVKSFIRVKGPKGMAIELFTRAVTTDEPLNMLPSGFVTGPSGMGHFAITSKQPEKLLRFWQEIFDARLSDRISQEMSGITLDITFLRLNERHHSIAVAATRGLRLDPIRTRIQHMNLLVETLEDLSGTFERLTDLGYGMAHEIGQHPNDREVSFYVLTPSGFELELGWNALRVEEAGWKQGYYNAISVWGHKPEKNTPLDKFLLNLGNFRRGIRSLFATEYSPL
ncbi:extradiol ring-cleavage dioxygenase [Oleomonas cavernae]|uniref:Extradiol ring-cleavage dioxygenase n=1 Tax=Oleomonas cavernae TaxID=2320859 RepID=A0A418WGZ6_9PROT|nr:VOC family protein [Oleomonas cavernae]RJF89295.1 extradiol ring-cleavage dioxygenase [Oleomonas cavernae]